MLLLLRRWRRTDITPFIIEIAIIASAGFDSTCLCYLRTFFYFLIINFTIMRVLLRPQELGIGTKGIIDLMVNNGGT